MLFEILAGLLLFWDTTTVDQLLVQVSKFVVQCKINRKLKNVDNVKSSDFPLGKSHSVKENTSWLAAFGHN